MFNGSPPPSRPLGSSDERLNAARGSMRDTLGAIRNIEQLLKSIRVGPKALASVIPDVHESCATLRDAFRVLLGAIAAHQPQAAQAVEQFVMPQLSDLEAALGRVRGGPLNARQRLALERVTTDVARALDVSRSLVELLEEAVGGLAARLDLRELAQEAFKGTDCAPQSRSTDLTATFACRGAGDVQTNPRVSLCLIAIGARLVASSGPETAVQALIQRTGAGALEMRIQPGAGAGEPATIAVPPMLGPLFECAQAAAQATGARFERSDADRAVVIQWQPAPE